MKKIIDINCDLGEGVANEAALMPYISSCSIACGGHTGDLKSIKKTVSLALKNNVKIGAHPSYPDTKNFGRKVIKIVNRDLLYSLIEQINLVQNHLTDLNLPMHHIKAHGALYNMTANNEKLAWVLIEAVKVTAPSSFLYAPVNSRLRFLAKREGLLVKKEAFADRNYNYDLTLVPRTKKTAVITDKNAVLSHLLKMIEEKKIMTTGGVVQPFMAETYCIHGDNSSALEILKFLQTELLKKGIKIA